MGCCDNKTELFFLIEGFLCTGSGSQNSSAGSELLPSGWNSEPTVYELNYSLNSVNFILKVDKLYLGYFPFLVLEIV